ncbi:hypothetical protein Bca52824_024808 [Brassica carinata]|uniref:Uncharacterized protein n=1 Tax=Brassica carinata TaxID=52824 RepID=A0A8X7VL60_BRACI|nr:hypothetical protein Bca52824_024808 [Brassica carinata]
MTGSDPFKNIRQRLNINREPRRSNNRGCPNCGGLDHEDPKSCFQRPRANGKRPVVVEPPPAENFVEDHAVFKTDGAVESAAGVEAAVEHLSSIEKNGLLAPSKTAKEIVYQKLTERRAIPYYLQKRPDPINVNDGFTSIPQLPRRAAWDGDTSQAVLNPSRKVQIRKSVVVKQSRPCSSSSYETEPL